MDTDTDTNSTSNEQMVLLWNSGLSASEVAIQLGMTRNTVIGRLTRMRKLGVYVETRENSSVSKSKPGVDAQRRKRRAQSPPNPQAAPPDPPQRMFDFILERDASEKRADILTLTSKHCRFIVGKDDRRGALYCSGAITYKSYCAEHAAMCYYVRTERSAAATA